MILIFDLDWTLWDGDKLYEDVIPILNLCQSKNMHMYIASHNSKADKYCKNLGIDKYFTNIFFNKNPKSKMIECIIRSHGHTDMCFFDDNFDNLIDVFNICDHITTVHTPQGLQWKNIQWLLNVYSD